MDNLTVVVISFKALETYYNDRPTVQHLFQIKEVDQTKEISHQESQNKTPFESHGLVEAHNLNEEINKVISKRAPKITSNEAAESEESKRGQISLSTMNQAHKSNYFS